MVRSFQKNLEPEALNRELNQRWHGWIGTVPILHKKPPMVSASDAPITSALFS
jgi:hypothetical protein